MIKTVDYAWEKANLTAALLRQEASEWDEFSEQCYRYSEWCKNYSEQESELEHAESVVGYLSDVCNSFPEDAVETHARIFETLQNVLKEAESQLKDIE